MLLALCAARADTRVVGTDLLDVEFSKALYAFAGRSDFPLALAFDGSRPGLDQLKAHRADLALLALPAEEEAALAGLESFAIAYHVVVVLVPTAMPLERVTLSELAGIFGEGGPTDLSRWGELGLGGDWAIGAIAPLAPAAGRSIATEYFRHVVLHDRAFKSVVVRYAAIAELPSRLAGGSRAIALVSLRPAGLAGAKVIPVATDKAEPAFTPTPENLHSGDYPLRLPLRVVFRHESAPMLRPLLEFLFGDEAAADLERAGVVPLAPAARRQQLLAAEKL